MDKKIHHIKKFNENEVNLLNSLMSLSFMPVITKLSRTAYKTDENIIENDFLSGFLISDISERLPLLSLKRNLFTDKSLVHPNNVNYCLINNSTIANLRQDQFLPLIFLGHISGSDNCPTSVESLACAVESAYK